MPPQSPTRTPSSTKLAVSSRQPSGSRGARRLRRTGRVPGVLYGGGGDPVSFDVEARELRSAMAAAGAVLDLSIDGADPTSVVVKDAQHHPVRGETVHIDFLRVRLDIPIQAIVPLELHGAEESPGVKAGGILEQITRELNIEALPTSIPSAITHDVTTLEIGETLLLEAIEAPEGVTLLDDLQETVVATLTPPRLQSEAEPDVETETEIVGEGGAEAGADGAADGSSDDAAGE